MVYDYPIADPPEIYGLHLNANILCQSLDSESISYNCLLLQPKSSGGGDGMSPDEMVIQLADALAEKMPLMMNIKERGEKLPMYIKGDVPDSMTNFLFQEVERFNNLLKVIMSSLSNIKKAIKGLILMSPALIKLHGSFLLNEVPLTWTKAGYNSMKKLAPW